jgi:hypothetical protein
LTPCRSRETARKGITSPTTHQETSIPPPKLMTNTKIMSAIETFLTTATIVGTKYSAL